MMSYFIIGICIVAVLLYLGFTVAALESLDSDGKKPVIIVAVFSWSCLFAYMAYLVDLEESKGPCVKYETKMYYNAATKTMMPAKVCVERGEWEEEE